MQVIFCTSVALSKENVQAAVCNSNDLLCLKQMQRC